MYIIIYGNLSDGFNFRGPFDSFDEAHEYYQKHGPDESSWITELNPPVTEEEETPSEN